MNSLELFTMLDKKVFTACYNEKGLWLFIQVDLLYYIYSFNFLSNLYFNNPVSKYSLSMTGTPSLMRLLNDFLSSGHDTITKAGSMEVGFSLIHSPPPHWMISWHMSGVGCIFLDTWIFRPKQWQIFTFNKDKLDDGTKHSQNAHSKL